MLEGMGEPVTKRDLESIGICYDFGKKNVLDLPILHKGLKITRGWYPLQIYGVILASVSVKRCDDTPNRSRAAGHDVLSQRLTGCREIMKSLCKVNSTVTVG